MLRYGTAFMADAKRLLLQLLVRKAPWHMRSSSLYTLHGTHASCCRGLLTDAAMHLHLDRMPRRPCFTQLLQDTLAPPSMCHTTAVRHPGAAGRVSCNCRKTPWRRRHGPAPPAAGMLEALEVAMPKLSLGPGPAKAFCRMGA